MGGSLHHFVCSQGHMLGAALVSQTARHRWNPAATPNRHQRRGQAVVKTRLRLEPPMPELQGLRADKTDGDEVEDKFECFCSVQI